ncbi:DUF6378 domain-containing protein [Eubacteriales bacterium OttesenSCG-928-M02]|nr:DUF6378 domain-containing protein [Eubacteriales bacterium OttesenSCG-928-M02]
MNREEYLNAARECVCGARQDEYGDAQRNFDAIAEIWGWYTGYYFDAQDVAIMMAGMKLARLKTGEPKEDSFVDAIGYLALAGELASREAMIVEAAEEAAEKLQGISCQFSADVLLRMIGAEGTTT